MVLNTYENGKRKNKRISTGLFVKGNKKLAERVLRETLRDYENPKEPPVKSESDILFCDAVREWHNAAAIRVDPMTLQGYEAIATRHVLPYFDALQIKLTDIDRHVLQKYFDEKYRNGRKDGKGGLSSASLKLHKNVLYRL
jgi:hypothetical protein